MSRRVSAVSLSSPRGSAPGSGPGSGGGWNGFSVTRRGSQSGDRAATNGHSRREAGGPGLGREGGVGHGSYEHVSRLLLDVEGGQGLPSPRSGSAFPSSPRDIQERIMKGTKHHSMSPSKPTLVYLYPHPHPTPLPLTSPHFTPHPSHFTPHPSHLPLTSPHFTHHLSQASPTSCGLVAKTETLRLRPCPLSPTPPPPNTTPTPSTTPTAPTSPKREACRRLCFDRDILAPPQVTSLPPSLPRLYHYPTSFLPLPPLPLSYL